MSIARPFALGTFAHQDGSFAGLVRDLRVADLRPHLGAEVTVRALLENWDASFPRLVALELASGAFDRSLEELRPLAPVTPVGQIFQAGANYRQHVLALMEAAAAREDNSDGLSSRRREQARRAFEDRLAHGEPFVFLGSPHAVVGARDQIVLPSDSAQSDWELELAVVVGRRARRVPRDRAMNHVAGYMIANDLTARDRLAREDARDLGLDWLAGKNAPTFLPLGPLFVPAAFVPDPSDLRIQLRVNGQTMQDESTADMVFDIPRLIEFVSNATEMRPGDVLLTGSPAGNGASHGRFLAADDVIEGEITGLGMQRNTCTAERAELPTPAA